MRFSLIGIAMILILAGSVLAVDDLYLVSLDDAAQVGTLVELDARVVHYGKDGVLVLIDRTKAEQLDALEISNSLLSADVSLDRLVTDRRRDEAGARTLVPVYQEGEFRLFLLDSPVASEQLHDRELQSVRGGLPLSLYQPTQALSDRVVAPTDLLDLQALIDQVSTDSLWTYVSSLQAFPPRVAGTVSNRNARDWLKGKFEEFGYTGVALDTFETVLSGTPATCYNVIASKTGTLYPEFKVVIGAHFDAVAGSPGADDNGSGSAAVLEIARILKDVETDMSIDFVLFDAEEFGLYGSWHYAQSAYEAGETIQFMMNQDMIAYNANTNSANVYYGTEAQYALRFIQLADSLAGLTVIGQGSSAGSDHYPFTQFGIPVAFAAENVFSAVYHSYQDSTSYMSFPYMTRMVQSALATCYWVSQAEGPQPSLEIAYTTVPEYAVPGSTTDLDLSVSAIWGGSIVPGSPTMNYQVDGGAWTQVSLTSLGGDAYQATFPAFECGQQVNYYVSAEETSSGMIYQPDPATPALLPVATDFVIDMDDDFETDQGWTTTVSAATGGWQRGVPVNDPSWNYDPLADGDGSGQCWLTENEAGNTDVDGGYVRLISPSFDFSNGGYIEYLYFLVMNNPAGTDRLLVEGNDGDGVWIEIARHEQDMGFSWKYQSISESDLLAAGLDLTANFSVRFTANDDTPASVVEAGVDGFRVSHYPCVTSCCGLYTGGHTGNTDCDPEGKMNLADITTLIDHVYISKAPLCCPENGNVDWDTEIKVNLADITQLIDHIYISKNPTDLCQ